MAIILPSPVLLSPQFLVKSVLPNVGIWYLSYLRKSRCFVTKVIADQSLEHIPYRLHFQCTTGQMSERMSPHCSPCLVSTEKSYIIVMLVLQGTIPVLDTTSVIAKIRFTSSLLSSKGSELL